MAEKIHLLTSDATIDKLAAYHRDEIERVELTEREKAVQDTAAEWHAARHNIVISGESKLITIDSETGSVHIGSKPH